MVRLSSDPKPSRCSAPRWSAASRCSTRRKPTPFTNEELVGEALAPFLQIADLLSQYLAEKKLD
jgi:hypothetical protein